MGGSPDVMLSLRLPGACPPLCPIPPGTMDMLGVGGWKSKTQLINWNNNYLTVIAIHYNLMLTPTCLLNDIIFVCSMDLSLDKLHEMCLLLCSYVLLKMKL